MTADNIIELKNVVKIFDEGTIKALDSVDLEIKEGEFVSVIGPSGCGKSTLLNMIGALDQADTGDLKVAGNDLMQNKDFSEFRLNKIGFVFQLHNLIPNLTVQENVELPLMEGELTDLDMAKRAKDLLESVNLENRLDQVPTKLSGGERQRVAIARALINHPSIILADEPTGSLDSKMGDIILNLLRDIHKKENVTIVLVTHEEYVANSAERIIKMMDGKIVT